MASDQLALFDATYLRAPFGDSEDFLKSATSANDGDLPRRFRDWISVNAPANDDEIVVDLFAGGGGATEGIEKALGRPVTIAINHDPNALILHSINHPETEHYIESVFAVDPVKACRGRPVGWLHASPTCTHFSQARSGPLDYHEARRIRGLAWIVVRWCAAVRPRFVSVENVPAFEGWCRLDKNGKVVKARKGEYFRKWVRQLEALGYRVEWKTIKAADHGSPTIRERIYVLATCDEGVDLVFPEPSHGPGRPKPYVAAADILDWSLPTSSIFGRKKPLKENSLKRIAAVVVRHILRADEPFVVPDANSLSVRASSISIHRGNRHGSPVTQPLHTVTSGGGAKRAAGAAHALGLVQVDAIQMAAMAQHNEDAIGWAITEPMSTLLKKCSQQQVVTASMTNYYSSNNGSGGDLTQPIGAMLSGGNHHGLVEAVLVGDSKPSPEALRVARFLKRYYTPGKKEPKPTIDILNGVLIHRGLRYQIFDIRTRMIKPRECFRAQGFGDDYIIDPICTYRTKSGRFKRGRLPDHEQVAKAGNSVCPQVMEAIVRANYMPRRLQMAA